MRFFTATFALLLTTVLFLPISSAFAAEESAYERVMRTGTIRCGYMTGEPYFMKDPATGALSGIWYDYVEEMGKALGFKIDWAEETGLGDVPVALDAGRIDAFCVGLWISPERARVMDFVAPITYQIVNAYVRQDEVRFDDALAKADSADVRVSCIDGEMSASIARQDFPKAKTLCLPQLTPFSDMFLNVLGGKADIVFASPAAIASFNQHNPPGLKKVGGPYPLRLFPESIPVARGSDDLRRMLDHTTGFLINSGRIEKILKKYSKSDNDFIRPAKPYEASP